MCFKSKASTWTRRRRIRGREVAAAGHHRMTVNLARAAVGRWLTPLGGRSLDKLQTILNGRQRPYYEHRIAA